MDIPAVCGFLANHDEDGSCDEAALYISCGSSRVLYATLGVRVTARADLPQMESIIDQKACGVFCIPLRPQPITIQGVLIHELEALHARLSYDELKIPVHESRHNG